ncbi:MAG TPA: phosphoribosyltransferase [Rhizomicrobium sp.]|jgi:predicted phosphoribosyltransferase
MHFRNREDAGRQLAVALVNFNGGDCVVLALPRGGVPVAAEVAHALNAPLELLLVRKIGAPRQPELAIGSVMDGEPPVIVRDDERMRLTGTSPRQFDEICVRELAEIARRRQLYIGSRPQASVTGKVAIVVDDGLATGNTMRVALQAVRPHKPAMLVMAVPVAPAGALEKFQGDANHIVCLATPEPFGAVGCFYDDFSPTSDEDVIALMAKAEHERAAAAGASACPFM